LGTPYGVGLLLQLAGAAIHVASQIVGQVLPQAGQILHTAHAGLQQGGAWLKLSVNCSHQGGEPSGVLLPKTDLLDCVVCDSRQAAAYYVVSEVESWLRSKIEARDAA
jgi:hypothetical protein